MKYENAYRSVVEFLGSNVGSEFDLTDAQAEELAKRLVTRVKVDIVMQPEAVLSHAEALFPKPDEDYLRRQQQKSQQPKQAHAEAVEVIRQFLNNDWASVAPGCLLPTVSKINHKLFFDAVNASANKNGFVRRDHLANIAGYLFQHALLEKAAAPAEPPPPPPPSPQEQARELAKKQYDFGRKINDRDTSPIKGAKEAAKMLVDHKPVLTESQRLALNAKKREDDAIIAEALRRVEGYQGYSHSRSFSGRGQLREVFKKAMDEGLPASDVLRAVEAEASRLTDSGSIR